MSYGIEKIKQKKISLNEKQINVSGMFGTF